MIKRLSLRIRVRCLVSAVTALTISAFALAKPCDAYALDEVALRAYQETFARELCAEGASWLRCFQLDPANCNTVTGGLIERCTRSFIEKQKAPAKDAEEVRTASKKIVQCIERDFRQQYEAFKLNTRECKNL